MLLIHHLLKKKGERENLSEALHQVAIKSRSVVLVMLPLWLVSITEAFIP